MGSLPRPALDRSVFAGPAYEGMIAYELAKRQINAGRRREVYYFRDQQGLEIDFIIPGPDGGLTLLEAKYSRTPTPVMAKPLLQIRDKDVHRPLRQILVHRATRTRTPTPTIAPGVEVMSAESFFKDRE